MNVVVQIGGREAIPVRAIPFLTQWEVLSPDEIADALSDEEDSWHPDFGGLRAFNLADGQPVEIRPAFWRNFVSRQLQGISDELKASEVSHDAGYIAWREAAIKALPSDAFVWLDEFEPRFEKAFSEESFGGFLKNEQWVPGQRIRADLKLDFSPFLADPFKGLILESLQTGNPQHPVAPLSREEWEGLSKGDKLKAWWDGRAPVADITDEDQARADFLDGFDSALHGAKLDAGDWVKYPSVTARDAALLVCGINPTVYPDPEVSSPAGARLPTFRKVKSAFSSVAKDGQDRTLKDWVAVAGDLCPQVEIDARVLVALRSVKDLTVGSVFFGAPVETATPERPSEPLPAKSKGSSRRGWFEATSAFIAKVMREGQHSTAKELFRALKDGAGTPDSPFDKGEGVHRHNLYVREIRKPLTLKTLQNNMSRLRDLARR